MVGLINGLACVHWSVHTNMIPTVRMLLCCAVCINNLHCINWQNIITKMADCSYPDGSSGLTMKALLFLLTGGLGDKILTA